MLQLNSSKNITTYSFTAVTHSIVYKNVLYTHNIITSPSGKLLAFRHCKPQLSGWLMNNNDPTLRESNVNCTCCSYCCLHWPCKTQPKPVQMNVIIYYPLQPCFYSNKWVLFSIYQQEVVGSVSYTDMKL